MSPIFAFFLLALVQGSKDSVDDLKESLASAGIGIEDSFSDETERSEGMVSVELYDEENPTPVTTDGNNAVSGFAVIRDGGFKRYGIYLTGLTCMAGIAILVVLLLYR